jgi:membrane protein implicated in regulation of membrane protease activity
MEYWHWFLLGLVLTALEIVVPGFVIFWFGIAGVLTGVLAIFVHNDVVELAIFAVLSGILVFTSQKIARRWTRKTPDRIGSERLHGAHGTVTSRIVPPQMGMVKVLGETWRAESDTVIEAGSPVRVERADGTHLIVEPARSETAAAE